MTWLLASALVLLTQAVPAQPAGDVRLAFEPATPYLEQTSTGQSASIDLIVSNQEAVALDIDRLEVTAFDADGHVLLQRFVDGNGIHPSIRALSSQRVEANQQVTVFHPFPPFAAGLPIHHLRYIVELSGPEGTPSLSRSLEVPIATYRNASSLQLPLRGRFINYDGHDELGHHRRFDAHFAPMAAMGFTTNFMRYSYDFVPVDDRGEMRTGDPADNASWFGFGKQIHAVAAGKVVSVSANAPDNRQFDQEKIKSNPMVLFGNVVVVDHGHGEFGVYAHAKQGSIRVKVGQVIKRGDVLGQVGASGSAFFPHLHFELQDGPDTRAEGLPSYFDEFFQIVGQRRFPRRQSTVDTGEIVEAK